MGMIFLENGQWLGRGSVVIEGRSRGQPVLCDVRVQRDDDGVTLTGEWCLQDQPDAAFSIRVATNDEGTYTLFMELAGDRLHGTAKLDSPPNLGLVWNDGGSVHATFALFAVSRGYGFRGFVRDASTGHVYTWEVAFALKQEVVKGGNVVSLNRRRR